MRALALGTIATIALALPAGASSSDVEVIDEVVQATIDERVDAYDLSAVYAIITDPDTTPRCREYADLALLTMATVDLGQDYPESRMIQTMYGWAMEAVKVARNNCLLAI